jgi:hypothetical protein
MIVLVEVADANDLAKIQNFGIFRPACTLPTHSFSTSWTTKDDYTQRSTSSPRGKCRLVNFRVKNLRSRRRSAKLSGNLSESGGLVH